MKQTAVEWLYDTLNKCFDKLDNGEYDYTDFVNACKEVREQAKEMEKEQIIEAFDYGDSNVYDKDGEQYYNETFKTK